VHEAGESATWCKNVAEGNCSAVPSRCYSRESAVDRPTLYPSFYPCSKGAWFQALGYARDCWQELASDLLAIAATCEQFATVRTLFGVKYIVQGQIGRKSHRTASVLAVWIVEADRPPRLVTAYPDEDS